MELKDKIKEELSKAMAGHASPQSIEELALWLARTAIEHHIAELVLKNDQIKLLTKERNENWERARHLELTFEQRIKESQESDRLGLAQVQNPIVQERNQLREQLKHAQGAAKGLFLLLGEGAK